MNDIFILSLANSEHKAIIDTNKMEKVIAKNWTLNSHGYVVTYNFKRDCIYLARLLLENIPDGLVVDHINRNKLDNRICNLRTVTVSINALNQDKRKNTTSRFKGVYFHSVKRKWIARVKINYNHVYGGIFKSEIEAAKKANELYKQYAGEFAVLNDV